MQLERFVRTLGLFLAVGLVGLAGGCGPGPQSPADQKVADEIIRKEHAGHHQQLKADVKKIQADAKKIEGASKKGGHRGQTGP